MMRTLLPHGVNDDYFAVINEPYSYKSNFTVIFSVIDPLQALLVEKYPGGISERDAVLSKI